MIKEQTCIALTKLVEECKAEGECHRHAPTKQRRSTPDLWPRTIETDFCGDHPAMLEADSL